MVLVPRARYHYLLPKNPVDGRGSDMQQGLPATQAVATALARSEEVKRLSSAGAALTRTLEASGGVGAAVALARSAEVKRLSSAGAALTRTLEASGGVGAAVALARSEEVKRLSSAGAALARTLEASGGVGAAVALARSAEVKRLSSAGAALARTMEASGGVGAAVALARSEEVKRLSSAGAALTRTLEASGGVGAAVALARSAEVKRLSSAGAALARTLEASGGVGAAVALARSAEVKRLSSAGAALARTMEASGGVGAAVALARSAEVKRLSSAGAVLARTLGASKQLAISARPLRVVNAHRSSIALALKVGSGPRIGMRIGQRASNRLLDESAFGYKRLAHLGHVVSTEDPYSQPVADLIDHEPGDVNTTGSSDSAEKRDEAAMHAGISPESIAFPSATCETVLFSAGFRLSFASVSAPQAVESPDSDAAFNPQHWQILSELEQRLRQVVEQHLEKLAGSKWIRQRIPEAVRDRWMDRQNEDRADGRSVYPAIQYADFMDLADVITRKDNWREAFQAVFRDKNDITVSLRRLHPVRKALAHSRPIGRVDVLTLVSEASRIFGALGMRVLH